MRYLPGILVMATAAGLVGCGGDDGAILGPVTTTAADVRDIAFIDDYLWVLGYSGGHKLSRVVP